MEHNQAGLGFRMLRAPPLTNADTTTVDVSRPTGSHSWAWSNMPNYATMKKGVEPMPLIRPRPRGLVEQHGRRPVLTGRGPEAASTNQESVDSGWSFRMKQLDARASRSIVLIAVALARP
jgi:hypothetical protein